MSTATTLAATCNAADTTITVTTADGWPGPQFRVAIGAETMQVVEGPPGSTTWSVVRDLVGAIGAVVGGDDFEGRNSADTWGSGIAWKRDNTDASFDFSIDASVGKGRLEFLAASADVAPFLALDERPVNVESRFMATIDALPGASDDNKLHLRVREFDNANRDHYRIRATIKPSTGDVDLRLGKQIGGTATVLGSVVTKTGLVTAGGTYWLAMQATGVSPTTLNAKMWDAADDEPSSWDVTTTDSESALQASGDGVGIRLENTAAATTMPVYLFDDLQVTRLAGGVSHANGSAVVLVEETTGPVAIVGHGAPCSAPPSGALYVDIDASPPVLYVRVGSSWYSETLT